MPGEDFHLSVDVRLQAHGLPVHRGTVNAVHARTRLMSWPSRARQAPGPRPQASAWGILSATRSPQLDRHLA
jgi:hypothetical protein